MTRRRDSGSQSLGRRHRRPSERVETEAAVINCGRSHSACLARLTGTRPSHDDGTTAAAAPSPPLPLPLPLFPLLLVLELPPRHLNFGRTNDDVQLGGAEAAVRRDHTCTM